jgi:hypothetical protein
MYGETVPKEFPIVKLPTVRLASEPELGAALTEVVPKFQEKVV